MPLTFNLPTPGGDEGSRLPPEAVRFLDVHTEPWPDGRRVRVHVSITPFAQRPNLDFSIVDATGRELASTTIIENVDARLVITLHLRGEPGPGPLVLAARLAYPDLEAGDAREIPFDLPPAAPAAG